MGDEYRPDPNASRAYEAGQERFLGTPRALARLAAEAYMRSARWTLVTSARTASRVMRAAANGQTPAEVFRSTRSELQEQARRFLGIPIGPEPAKPAEEMTDEEVEVERAEARQSLRDRGAELLRRSADVNFEEDAHPAYARILGDLAPDEGRILRMLATEGPQPSVDVRAGWLPLKAASELVASGLNMIGTESGCRHLDDVPAYLNNLFRLGLIWFSSEHVSDPLRYQVLEAQPAVVEAIRDAGRARTVRRSVELTPFGKDFCDLCLPGEVGDPDSREDGDRPG